MGSGFSSLKTEIHPSAMRVVQAYILVVSIGLSLAIGRVHPPLKTIIDKGDKEEPLDEISEESYENIFDVPPAVDSNGNINATEEKARSEALKKNEERIHNDNIKFEKGEITWFDGLNEHSNVPDDELLEVTGDLNMPPKFMRGDFDAPEDEQYDEESERYFDQFRYDRGWAPDSYSSVDRGYVSPVKNQGNCGSCVAFASMGAIETCFRKASGVFGDYSEQQLIDCAYNGKARDGCDGAYTHAYLKWAGQTKFKPTHESRYTYKPSKRNYQCPRYVRPYNQGVAISGSAYTYRAGEELLKRMVYENGAAVVGVLSEGPIQDYEGGIEAGCSTTVNKAKKTDHAVLVVGYGTENGVPYWLIKNSYGPRWGEKGFFKLKRGVHMCSIGYKLAVVKCKKVWGATEGPLTTAKPCVDRYTNCPEIAKTRCYKNHKVCEKSCGMCKGMTPARSYTCYDKWGNCPKYKWQCKQGTWHMTDCRATCGKC